MYHVESQILSSKVLVQLKNEKVVSQVRELEVLKFPKHFS